MESEIHESMIPTPTVGEILKDEFMVPFGISTSDLAESLRVSAETVSDLIHGERRITTDMALRLSRLFGMSDRFWINLQTDIDIRNRKQALASELEKIHPITEPA
ncbi:MAG: HigA family addiction module antitoxin [Desulfococcaceae bacterium]